jgi:hypothetical protein
MISLITALTIQENGAEVTTHGPTNKKYGFEIYSIIRESYRPHLTSTAIYDSKKTAEKEGKEILKIILDTDLDKKRKELSDNLGDTETTVQKIIDKSKE